MRSYAHVKAHPLHPMLVPFPFAFLSGALVFDVLSLILSRQALGETGAHLTVAGLLSALLAAVPGLLDYLNSVPPNSSAKARATRHGLGNLAALVCFAGAWLTRDDTLGPTLAAILLETAGVAALAYAGWLGGTLVTRNLISVDHRSAESGKWQEATLEGPRDKPLVVGDTDELKDGQMKLLRVNGQRLVLARANGDYVVFEDRCTHKGGSLADGVAIDGTVQCLWHGSQFDVHTGEVICGPAKQRIAVYEVQKRKDGQLLLVSPPG